MAELAPNVVEVKFNTSTDSMHGKVLSALRQRKQMSFDRLSNRRAKWSEMEDEAQAYIQPTKKDSIRENARKSGIPQYTTIKVPYSYGMLMSWHTYMTSVFLARNPVHQFDGRYGETADACRAMEAIMDHSVQAGDHMVPYYIWLMDMGKYGLGILGSYWAEESSYISNTRLVEEKYFGLVTGRQKKVREVKRVPGFTGIRVYNVRPQDWFPDPRVSLARFQEGEFCGRYTEVGWNTIIKRQAQGKYFNVDELKKTKLNRGKPGTYDPGSPRIELPNTLDMGYTTESASSDDKKDSKALVGLLEMTVEIVPRDWGIGISTYPEKWVFSLGNDAVVIGCEPLGELHQKFPFDIMEYEIEGYALGKRSMLEITEKLNDTMTFLFDSHMLNVRRSMNDQLVVDPSRLVMKDFTDPGAGKLVRVKPLAYGQDTRLAWSQITVQDITRSNMADAEMVAGLMQRITGIVDPVQGMLNSGGRRTATEVRTSSTMGINRLKTNAEYASALGFTPFATKSVSMLQNHHNEEREFRIAGALTGKMRKVTVTPEMIAGQYNYVPIDGTMPMDRMAQSMLWKELFMLFKQIPQLAQGYDIYGILDMIAWLSGVKNMEQYRLDVVSNENIQNEVQAGNLVPMKGAIGGDQTGSSTVGGSVDAGDSVVQLSQSGSLPGVGRAG